MTVFETTRLTIRHFNLDDAPFIVELVNDPAWLRFIGDRGVRTIEDAAGYLTKGPFASYAKHGFGLFLVARREDGIPLGMCGLLKRDVLPAVDLGFAYLPRFGGCGYALEAATATVAYARDVHGLKRLLAITSPDNDRSIRLLGKLGFVFEKSLQLTEGAPASNLYEKTL